MRYLWILVQISLFSLPSSASGEDKAFAEKLLASKFTNGNVTFSSLTHSEMGNCVTPMLSQYPGLPPDDYEYVISEITEQGINNGKVGAMMAGIKEPSYAVMPTHEIVITWKGDVEYTPGHPCFAEPEPLFMVTLAPQGGEWRVAPVCVSEVEAANLKERKQKGLEASKERKLTVDGLYTSLSAEKIVEFEELLNGFKVKAIYAYSEQLGVDMTTAYAFWDKMCAEYPEGSHD
jgi:hypothetical protein